MPIDNENEVTTNEPITTEAVESKPEAVEATEAQNESQETELNVDEPSNSLPESEDKAE